jgi:pyrimidine operon attenuation protein/uracil phosphoribosyltransferase
MTARADVVMDPEAIARSVRRLAHEVVERVGGAEWLARVGIHRGGVPLATRIAAAIAEAERGPVAVCPVETGLAREDAATALRDPKIGPSRIDGDGHGRDVVRVDDGLHTGQTARTAIDGLLDDGRPRRVWLAGLLDRGGRESPIASDFVGRTIDVLPGSRNKFDLERAGEERACRAEATR